MVVTCRKTTRKTMRLKIGLLGLLAVCGALAVSTTIAPAPTESHGQANAPDTVAISEVQQTANYGIDQPAAPPTLVAHCLKIQRQTISLGDIQATHTEMITCATASTGLITAIQPTTATQATLTHDSSAAEPNESPQQQTAVGTLKIASASATHAPPQTVSGA